jgi:hypothetical protein
MAEIKQILCPLDLSEISRHHAIRQARCPVLTLRG